MSEFAGTANLITSTKTCPQDGMQRDIFNKFLAKLEEHSEYVYIGSEVDYRRLIAERSTNQVRIKQLQFYISFLSYKLQITCSNDCPVRKLMFVRDFLSFYL